MQSSSSSSPLHSSLSPPPPLTVHSLASVRPPALITSASNLLSLSRANLSLSQSISPYGSKNELSKSTGAAALKPLRILAECDRKRSLESQELTHTFYASEEEGGDERRVVLRHRDDVKSEREEEKRQFEYRMSLILERLDGEEPAM